MATRNDNELFIPFNRARSRVLGLLNEFYRRKKIITTTTGRKPTHNEFTTNAFVSIPLDVEADVTQWSMSVYMPEEIVEQFRQLSQPVEFVMCSTGSGPVGQPNERHYISLIRKRAQQ